jgi:hypothetical protein
MFVDVFISISDPHRVGMIDECERCKVVELRCVCGKCSHGADGGKDAIPGVLCRKPGYELLQALLTITFAGRIERVRQAVGPKKKNVTLGPGARAK